MSPHMGRAWTIRKRAVCGLLLVCCCFSWLIVHFNQTGPQTSKYDEGRSVDKDGGGKGLTGERTNEDINRQMDTLQWSVNVSSRRSDEVQHIIFIKVHRAASTTLFNMLIRFALSRDLHVMFPAGDKDHLSENKAVLSPIIPHPPSPPFLFDILCNHVVFREHQVRPWFPADTKLITILRRPWDQVVSAFNYYRQVWEVPYLLCAPNVKEFLLKRPRFEPVSPLSSFTNNRMSLDLGLPPDQLTNSSHVPAFLDRLQDTFHLVLIAEHFDESLVLLRRRLGWTMKDIVYIKLNAHDKNTTAIDENSDPKLKEAFNRFNHFDVAVYDHFIRLFVQEVGKEGPEFFHELRAFAAVERDVRDFCSKSSSSADVLRVGDTVWNEAFTVETGECIVLTMDEVTLHSLAKARQLSALLTTHDTGQV
ncbi:galactose-3-O-sulfotransferase 2-like [Littorina saxatilis]|uniref:Uncharacterized protein n=1 Tax=Littorina saxatilis TaxID=31220 RepID=A0AAN9G7G8_9CAEN